MPQTTFTVELTGTQETPPNASAASGAGVVVWDSDTSTAAYEFIVSGLDFGPALGLAPMTAITDDDVTAMHFHNGDRGVAAPVVFGQLNPAQDPDLQVLMNDDGSWDISGVWDITDPTTVPITDFAVLLTQPVRAWTCRCTGTFIPRHSRQARSGDSWSRRRHRCRMRRQ